MAGSILIYAGYAGASLTTASFVPQLVRVWRSRSAQDISAAMYTMFITGLLLWIVYGVAISAWPIVVANTVTAIQALAILGMKVRFGRPRPTYGSERQAPSPGSSG
jgi:MtN3 and saliva related transmembrane protein